MGLLNIFDKKYCDICGNQIKLLGSRKTVDGVICSDCAGKLSPYFTERKASTLEDIKQQLAYREENRAQLENFDPDYVVDGTSKQVRVDQNMGKFIVYDGMSYKNGNADLFDLDSVLSCVVDITEHETEIRDRDEQGHLVSRMPKEFKYEYSFQVTICVDHPYVSTISYEMTNFAHRPQSPYEDLFEYNVEEASALYKILTGDEFKVNYNHFRFHEKAPEHRPARREPMAKPARPMVQPRNPERHAPQPGNYSRPIPENNQPRDSHSAPRPENNSRPSSPQPKQPQPERPKSDNRNPSPAAGKAAEKPKPEMPAHKQISKRPTDFKDH